MYVTLRGLRAARLTHACACLWAIVHVQSSGDLANDRAAAAAVMRILQDTNLLQRTISSLDSFKRIQIVYSTCRLVLGVTEDSVYVVKTALEAEGAQAPA